MRPNRHRIGFRLYRDDGTYEPLWFTPIRTALALLFWGTVATGLSKLGLQPSLGPFGPYLALLLSLIGLTFLLRVAIAYPTSVTFPALCAMFGLVLIGYAYLYQRLGIIGPGDVESREFGTCLYFSVVTFTTVGYGDFRPAIGSRPVAALEAITGYVYFGLFVAFISSRWSRPIPRLDRAFSESHESIPQGPRSTD